MAEPLKTLLPIFAQPAAPPASAVARPRTIDSGSEPIIIPPIKPAFKTPLLINPVAPPAVDP